VTIATCDFDFVREVVRRRSAIVLEPGKEYLVETRLGQLARQESYDSLEVLVAALRRAPGGDLERKVVDAMTTNETSFFRDLHPFEALRGTIVPELLASRSARHRLDLWCGACSSGQEPYSIAMVLREAFPQLASWDVRLLATDLSDEMLAKAREGRYSQLEVNRGLPAPYLVKYFDRVGTDWQVKPDLKRGIEFRPMNLIAPWPAMPAFDVVFLRNVLIYFDVDTKRMILNRIRRTMRPDGWLLLGGAETTMYLDDAYERVAVGRASCFRVRAEARTP
jgi:chemotaxis protein methyltransferase CheR